MIFVPAWLICQHEMNFGWNDIFSFALQPPLCPKLISIKQDGNKVNSLSFAKHVREYHTMFSDQI